MSGPVIYSPITINIPIEINAGDFATTVTVQGETVAYNKVHLPLMHYTKSGEPTVANMQDTFIWKENTDQTQVTVDISGSTIGSFDNGTAVVKALFKAALNDNDLRSEPMTSGAIYADGTARNTSTDPLKYYVDKDTHTLGVTTGSTVKAYLQEYLYDNLSQIIGLAATTGAIDITLSRDSIDASEIIASALVLQVCGNNNTEQGVSAAALRQNIYEQMFTLAPERFKESTLMRRDPAGNITYQKLPFQLNDTMAFLVTFKFPATQISAPVIGNAIRTGQTGLYVDTGSKINVAAGTDSTTSLRPNLTDFPSATIMIRVKLNDGAGAPGSTPVPVPTPEPSITPAIIMTLTSTVDGGTDPADNFPLILTGYTSTGSFQGTVIARVKYPYMTSDDIATWASFGSFTIDIASGSGTFNMKASVSNLSPGMKLVILNDAGTIQLSEVYTIPA